MFCFFLFWFLDEVSEARVTITEITRRYHELEVELRRLENERDELTAAYKEAEAVNLLNLTCFDSFCLQTVFFLLHVNRAARLKSNVLNVWLPSTDNSVTMPSVVSLRRMRKLNLSGK